MMGEEHTEPAGLWLYRSFCLAVIGVTYGIAMSEARRAELLGSVEWHSSPIDWCEENYEVTEAIVEFWNTMSGFVIFPITAIAWVLHQKMRTYVEPRFGFCLATLTCVGLGSIYFHATLSKLGQVLDEVTICWTNYYAILLVMPKQELEALVGSDGRRLIVSMETLLTVILITPVWGIFYPWVSHALTVSTLILLPWAIVQQFRKADPPTSAKRILKYALMAHGTAVFFWICDRLFCNELTAAVGIYPQFHAFWHVFVFLGGYFTVVGVAWVRSTGDGHNAIIRSYAGIPYTEVHQKV